MFPEFGADPDWVKSGRLLLFNKRRGEGFQMEGSKLVCYRRKMEPLVFFHFKRGNKLDLEKSAQRLREKWGTEFDKRRANEQTS